MIVLNDLDTNLEIAVNPETIKWIRLAPGLGTRITFVDNSYILVRETVQTCVEKFTKKSVKEK
jgi:uncharacterized protein YlzI (FlbEa/FlbD family)